MARVASVCSQRTLVSASYVYNMVGISLVNVLFYFVSTVNFT